MTRETLPEDYDDGLTRATGAGFAFGGMIGLGTGIASAIALPLYAGYKITDYICDRIDINSVSTICLDIAGAVGTLAMTIEYTLPTLSVAGVVVGGAIGAVTGRIVGKGLQGIEKMLKK